MTGDPTTPGVRTSMADQRDDAAKKKRAKLERLVWRHKHSDFRGKREDGTKCVLKFVAGVGTCSVEISSLTDEECLDMIPKKVREAEGLASPEVSK